MMALPLELSRAIYTGYVRAGVLPVQRGRDCPFFAAGGLIFGWRLGRVHKN